MIVDLILFAVLVGGYVLVARKYDRLLKEIAGRTEARDRALQAQAKKHVQRAAQTDRAAAKTLDAARAALDAAREVREDDLALKDSLHAVLRDPRVQRMLDNQGGE